MITKLSKYSDRETLERLKRWPSLAKRFPFVRIYSAEHGAYWRDTGQGYTEDPKESAVWHIEEAYKRTCHCGPEKKIQFVPVNVGPKATCKVVAASFDTGTIEIEMPDFIDRVKFGSVDVDFSGIMEASNV